MSGAGGRAGGRPVHSEPEAEQIIPSAGGFACWGDREIAKKRGFGGISDWWHAGS